MPLNGLPHGRQHGEQRFRGSSHRIKIGLTCEQQGKSSKYVGPTTTNGFFLVRNTVASIKAANSKESSHVIAYDLMEALGFPKAKVDEALRLHREAPPGLLPYELDFVLLGVAVRNPISGKWLFPDVFDAEFEAFNVKGPGDPKNPGVIEDPEWAKHGLKQMRGCFCRGDGETAKRRSPDGTMRLVECNPTGKLGVPAEKFCVFHRTRRCRAGVDLVVNLIKPRKDPAEPIEPLLRVHHARFLLETTSIDNYLDFEGELEKAAEALQGDLSGIIGTLQFRLAPVIKPEDPLHASNGGPGVAPKISITLNRWQISARAKELGLSGAMALPDKSQSKGSGGGALPAKPLEIIDATYKPIGGAPQEQPAQQQQPAPPQYPAIHGETDHQLLLAAITEFVGTVAGDIDSSFDDAWADTVWIFGKSGNRIIAKDPTWLSPDNTKWNEKTRNQFTCAVADRLAATEPEAWDAAMKAAAEKKDKSAQQQPTATEAAPAPATTEPAAAGWGKETATP